MPARNGIRRSASLYDFRDMDLLHLLAERGDEEGWVEIADAASSLGFGEDLRPVAMRFAWMRKYGMLDYDERHKLWRLSPGGERVLEAKLRASQSTSLEKLPEEKLVHVMHSVTTHYQHASPMVADLLRREFLFGTKR